MDDRELLELAAKSAGYVVTGLGGMSRGVFVHHEGAQPDECGDLPNFHWDPLTDDGDALRLAVKLCLRIWTDGTGVVVESSGYPAHSHEYELAINNAGDIYSATRRAIVRAAAEIGRAM